MIANGKASVGRGSNRSMNRPPKSAVRIHNGEKRCPVDLAIVAKQVMFQSRLPKPVASGTGIFWLSVSGCVMIVAGKGPGWEFKRRRLRQ